MTICFPRLAGGAGRLGNQLWEIASTLGLTVKHQTDVVLPPWDYAPYFSLPEDIFTYQPGDDIVDATTLVPHIDERAKVYLQDWSLFKDIEGAIRYYFRPSPLAKDILHGPRYEWFHKIDKKCCLHVRRGDNVTHPKGIHPLRTLAYYQKAAERFPDHNMIVFSDDIPWCKNNIPDALGRDCGFIEGGVIRPEDWRVVEYKQSPAMDWVDLQLMAYCDAHIISNSSYAWWGAYLANHDDQVMYPSNWFGYKLPYLDAKLMFPPTWTEIEDLPEGRLR